MSNKEQALVSIIMANYNGQKYIGESVESVLAQSYREWELIIVDDGSSDNSRQVIEHYSKNDSRVKAIFLDQNCGVAKARNIGLTYAGGRYLGILDSDDYWHFEKLEKQINFMRETGAPFCSSSYFRVNERGHVLGMKKVPDRANYGYRDLLKSNPVGCLTVLIDQDKVKELKFPEIKMRNDYGLWLNITKGNHKLWTMADLLAYYRVHSNSLTSNKFRAAKYQWKLLRKFQKLNFINSLFYFTQYSVRGVLLRINEKIGVSANFEI